MTDHEILIAPSILSADFSKLGEEVGAAVVLAEGKNASERDLKDFVSTRLADFKVPRQLVILDELTYLCSWGWIDTSEVVDTIKQRPDHVNIVITGRDAPQDLIDIADTVTEMTEIKHAYSQGIRAKRGIDY